MVDKTFFSEYPEFIDTDVRKDRLGGSNGYRVTSEFMSTKHSIILPKDLVAGKSVLDLGCCVGATGAWALANGASHYTGVELQRDMVTQAKENLQKYFPSSKWSIHQDSVEKYLDMLIPYDIIVACGIIYLTMDYQRFLRKVAKYGKTVIIESNTPPVLTAMSARGMVETGNLAITQYCTEQTGVYEKGNSLVVPVSPFPSVEAVKLLFVQEGHQCTTNHTQDLNASVGKLYGKFSRFVLRFDRTHEPIAMDFASAYSKDDKELAEWTTFVNEDAITEHREKAFVALNPVPTWKFDDAVAGHFVSYAKRHIPDYERVIARCVDLCNKRLPKDARIIDVGCATGHTLQTLKAAGYTNLVGVDNSEAMASKIPDGVAEIVISSDFPVDKGPYDAVLCNWTLHFIESKLLYLQSIALSLKPGGMLILSDKTMNDGVDLEMYHDFKRSRGVSEQEIAEKAQSLVGVMSIKPVDWYLAKLPELGFSRVTVINSSYCFTTFLAIR